MDWGRNIRPYVLIENVVTHKSYRKKGYATECLHYAREIAERENCFHPMAELDSKTVSSKNEVAEMPANVLF